MGIVQERLNKVLKKLLDGDKKQVMEFAEFIYQKRKQGWKKALENVPEEDEELSPGEIKALQDAKEDIRKSRVRPLDDASLADHSIVIILPAPYPVCFPGIFNKLFELHFEHNLVFFKNIAPCFLLLPFL